MSKSGVASLLNSVSPSYNKSVVGDSYIYGKVKDVMLVYDPVKAKNFNVPDDCLGAIQFVFVSNDYKKEDSLLQSAVPLNPNKRAFPIKNEIVVITTGPTKDSTNSKGSVIPTYYYSEIVDIWNSPEHNSNPNDADFNGKEPATGKNFKEKGNIARLQHLPGDIIEEGRFGQSIRFGSSNGSVNAPWKGPEGAPLIIIRNGQPVNLNSDKTYIFEDINSSETCIAMLSSQTIDFTPSNDNFNSYSQKVDTNYRSSTVTIIPDQLNTTSASLQANDNTTAVSDTPPVNYQTEQKLPEPTSSLAEDEIKFLPDKEEPEYFQEFEDEGPRHTITSEQGVTSWFLNVSNTDITSYNPLSIDSTSGFTAEFICYMLHQQGPDGVSRIVKASRQNLDKVPNVPNKENINSNMYGKRLYPGSLNSGNVGSDFEKIFGPNYTPGNFLKYWKAKFSAKKKEAISKTSKYDTLFQKYSLKYSVPFDLIKTICYTESSFVNTAGNKVYKGLFSLSIKEFQKVYPGDYDVLNPDKNTDVAVRLIRNNLASANNIIKSV